MFILTRSGFAGIQRYATVTWSGDITSAFSTLRKQITAGLGFSISGTPYWTSDTGGYTMDRRLASARDGEALDEWRELNARWFQYSTFCPILRVHGTDRPREMWNIGDDTTAVYQTQLKFDRLRYALFPYIYSVAGAVTQDGSTMMRPLVMDFRRDATARTITDQYMFGPAFLVNPVLEYKARSRTVYLPAGSAWYDFWTGKRLSGAATVTADAPLETMPAVRPRRLDRSGRTGSAVHRRAIPRRTHALRLCRAGRTVLSLRRRRRHLRLRARAVLAYPDVVERRDADADARRARRQFPWHAGFANVQCRAGHAVHAGGVRRRRGRRPAGSLHGTGGPDGVLIVHARAGALRNVAMRS